MQKVIAKIYLQHLYHNATLFKSYTKTRVCGVVKADAYGHGVEQTVLKLQSVCDMFAVSLLDEAIAIKVPACGKDVLILTPPLTLNDCIKALSYDFTVTVADMRTAKLTVQAVNCLNKSAHVHLKVNTGMNRYGMNLQTLGKVCKFLKKYPQIKVEGLYSHLYKTDFATCEKQRLQFLNMQKVVRKYFSSFISHLSATYGAMLGKDFAFDMVRVGIGLYGYFPDGMQDIPESVKNQFPLKKGMQIFAPITATQTYKQGGIGYGTPKCYAKRLCVVRLGYADGFLRSYQNGLEDSNQQVNNLCMDAHLIDAKLKVGDWICLLDDAQKTAKLTSTISYEVLCAASKRCERWYVDE